MDHSHITRNINIMVVVEEESHDQIIVSSSASQCIHNVTRRLCQCYHHFPSLTSSSSSLSYYKRMIPYTKGLLLIITILNIQQHGKQYETMMMSTITSTKNNSTHSGTTTTTKGTNNTNTTNNFYYQTTMLDHDTTTMDNMTTTTIDENDDVNNHMTTLFVPKGIVWLVSFPNSGTTYTLKTIQSFTNTTTATNYGGHERMDDIHNSISVYPTTKTKNVVQQQQQPEGPYYRYTNLLPYTTTNAYILTKTHCEQQVTSTIEQFIRSCGTGSKFYDKNHTMIPTSYTINDIPFHGIVHLIRNPYNNIVARMNYQRTIWEKSHDPINQKRALFFPCNRTGLYYWCQYRDKKHSKSHDIVLQLHNGTFYTQYLQYVPCYMEFYLYFQWHIMVVDMIQSLVLQQEQQPSNHHQNHNNISSMILYYEDYGKNNANNNSSSNPTVQQQSSRKQNNNKDNKSTLQSIYPTNNHNINALLSFLNFTSEQIISSSLHDNHDDHYSNTTTTNIEFDSNHTYIDFYTMEQQIAIQQLAYVMTGHTPTWSLIQHYFT